MDIENRSKQTPPFRDGVDLVDPKTDNAFAEFCVGRVFAKCRTLSGVRPNNTDAVFGKLLHAPVRTERLETRRTIP